MAKKTTLAVGDRVAVKRAAMATLPRYANERGTIESICGGWLATVAWGPGVSTTINLGNLCRVGSVAFLEDVRS